MSDPVVPQPDNAADRAEAEAAGAPEQPAPASVSDGAATTPAVPETTPVPAVESLATEAPVAAPAVDPDVAAFEEAERSHPGTFVPSSSEPAPIPPTTATPAVAETTGIDPAPAAAPAEFPEETAPRPAGDATGTFVATGSGAAFMPPAVSPESSVLLEAGVPVAEPAAAPVEAPAAAYTAAPPPVVDPAYAAASQAPQPPQHPIFVQAPEPPRDRGNRGTSAVIGLLAALSFAVLMLVTQVLFVALIVGVGFESLGLLALQVVQSWAFWTPVAIYFLAFWLLGAIVNRGRWGLWVNLGLIVALIAWMGFVLGMLLQEPAWTLTFSQSMDVVLSSAFSPLGIASFIFARELTIWFGAWVARSGARKTVQNAEAQREYERTLEAGPTLAR